MGEGGREKEDERLKRRLRETERERERHVDERTMFTIGTIYGKGSYYEQPLFTEKRYQKNNIFLPISPEKLL
jgi:hypothetical protein